MSDFERTERIDTGSDQDETRRLSTYEERDHTQRLEVPPAPPWEPEDPRQHRHWDEAERRQARDEKRRWPTSLVVVFALVGLLLGVLGTLVATSSTRSEVGALRDQLAAAQEAVDARDRRIAELEQELEDERNRPIPNVPLPDLQIPDLRDIPGNDLLDQLQQGVEDLIDQNQNQNDGG
jgi:hypothetical protein